MTSTGKASFASMVKPTIKVRRLVLHAQELSDGLQLCAFHIVLATCAYAMCRGLHLDLVTKVSIAHGDSFTVARQL